jgi:hypothetical protein
VTRKTLSRIALVLALGALVLVPAGVAAPGGGGNGGGSQGKTTCTRSAPGVSVENNWAWGSTGSWGKAGQPLSYQIRVVNNDVYCASSSFVISLTTPDGFSASMPTNAISLKSTTQGYLWAYVTSPS